MNLQFACNLMVRDLVWFCLTKQALKQGAFKSENKGANNVYIRKPYTSYTSHDDTYVIRLGLYIATQIPQISC